MRMLSILTWDKCLITLVYKVKHVLIVRCKNIFSRLIFQPDNENGFMFFLARVVFTGQFML